MKRRTFLRQGGLAGFYISTGAYKIEDLLPHQLFNLTILHTNDVHSRIEPFPMDGGRYQGMGGAAKRAAMVKKIRKEEDNVLLLDAGDIFQGTPYFNYFGGELEFKLMSKMNYDAATIGNHDFDAGIDGLHKQLPNASFDLINANYDFSNTIMNGKVSPYKIYQKGEIKVGVLGLGIELNGLVPNTLIKETQYLDPIKTADKYASILKQDLKCDYVICLSHLGYRYREEKVSDVDVAKQTSNIDLIIGGHTHSYLYEPDSQKNKNGNEVLIAQVGWAGIALGRIDVSFEKNFKKKCISCKNKFVN